MSDSDILKRVVQSTLASTSIMPGVASQLQALSKDMQNSGSSATSAPTGSASAIGGNSGSGDERTESFLKRFVQIMTGAQARQPEIIQLFPPWFARRYPKYLRYASPTPSIVWQTPSTATMSLVYDSWPAALVDILDSEYMYRKDIREMVSKAFREGQMLQTAYDLGIPTRGRSKRAIIKDIASVFSSGRRSPRKRSPARRRRSYGRY